MCLVVIPCVLLVLFYIMADAKNETETPNRDGVIPDFPRNIPGTPTGERIIIRDCDPVCVLPSKI